MVRNQLPEQVTLKKRKRTSLVFGFTLTCFECKEEHLKQQFQNSTVLPNFPKMNRPLSSSSLSSAQPAGCHQFPQIPKLRRRRQHNIPLNARIYETNLRWNEILPPENFHLDPRNICSWREKMGERKETSVFFLVIVVVFILVGARRPLPGGYKSDSEAGTSAFSLLSIAHWSSSTVVAPSSARSTEPILSQWNFSTTRSSRWLAKEAIAHWIVQWSDTAGSRWAVPSHGWRWLCESCARPIVGPDGTTDWAHAGPLAGGGIDIDYCAFPTCPGNPRGIVSAPALARFFHLRFLPHTFVSVTLSGLERKQEREREREREGPDRDKEITGCRGSSSTNRFQLIRFFLAWASWLTRGLVSAAASRTKATGRRETHEPRFNWDWTNCLRWGN